MIRLSYTSYVVWADASRVFLLGITWVIEFVIYLQIGFLLLHVIICHAQLLPSMVVELVLLLLALIRLGGGIEHKDHRQTKEPGHKSTVLE